MSFGWGPCLTRRQRTSAGIGSSGIAPPKLLDAPPDLLLQGRIPSALRGRHEFRELMLLLIDEIDAPPL
jgi:hypothetical protein